MGYEYILFDLDGTVTDPAVGITNSVMYALKKYGITVTNPAELYKFIGPPLTVSFQEYYGFSDEQAKEATKFYREYFSEKGLFENEVYENMREVLDAIKKAGKQMIIATSKPTVFAERILEHFDLMQYFTFVAGSNLDGSRSDKAEVIQFALDQNGVEDKEKAIMIGDRKHDMIGAKKCGLTCLGVLYGYGTREELIEAGADYIGESEQDILKYVLEA